MKNEPINLASVAARVLGTDPLATGRHKALAGILADLLNDHEPLLHAEQDGATVTVSEKGGRVAMRFTVEAA